MPADRHEVGWGKALDLGTRAMDYDQAYVWGKLEGSACSQLAAVALDRYFVDARGQSFEAKTGKAICSGCVVVEECRQQALNAPNLPHGGVIGGVSASTIRNAREWRNYELGLRRSFAKPVPTCARPDWLERPEAVEMAESTLVHDELGDDR